MNLNYNEILDNLAEVQRELPSQQPLIDEKLFKHRLTLMAQAGYVFEQATIDALYNYLDGYSIGLVGNTGTGKTMFFRLLKPLAISGWHTPKMIVVSTLTLSQMSRDKAYDFIEQYLSDELVLDDVGAEAVNNTYGVKSDILPMILEQRARSNFRTHFTTNINSKELKERYGDRVVDRLRSFKIFSLSGKTKRHPDRSRLLVTHRSRIITSTEGKEVL